MSTIILQLILYCLLFTLLIKLAVKDNGINCLYFYPKEYINKAVEIGLSDMDTIIKKKKRFMSILSIVMLIALILIIAIWNRVTDYKTAFCQSWIFLIVMNWFDGIVIDKLWVGYGKVWNISKMKGFPYIGSWKQTIIKRTKYTLYYSMVAPITAIIIVLIGKIVYS